MNNRARRRVMAALPVGTGGGRAGDRSIRAVPSADASDALEVAVAWLARLAEGLDEGSAAELKAWLAADEIHRRVFHETAQVYDELNVIASLAWPRAAPCVDDASYSDKLV